MTNEPTPDRDRPLDLKCGCSPEDAWHLAALMLDSPRFRAKAIQHALDVERSAHR